MKIVSVTLAHNREGTIAGALACVAPYVDECLILDTGITDRTLEIARATVGEGEKLRVKAFPWVQDFARARNAALDFASERKADWAVMIDTDQRIDWNGVDPRVYLSGLTSKKNRVVLMRSRGGGHAKEQIFPLPTRGSYVGRTHEYFHPILGACEIPRARVWEVAKSPADLLAKWERDRAILEEDAKNEPENSRVWFYLGATLASLDLKDAAVGAYEKAYHCSLSPLEAAWTAYRGAQLECSRDNLEAALAWCHLGARKYATVEILTYKAWICSRQGDYSATLEAARDASVLGEILRDVRPSSFRDVEAYYEGPAGLAALACGALGDVEKSRVYEAERIRLRALRLEVET